MNTKIKNAILVGIQLPKTSVQDIESSLRELARLVTTLGYNVVGQITQKRNSDQSASIIGEGKLKELASWTDGTGKIASLVDRKPSKAAAKWQEEEEEEIPEIISGEKKESAQIVIVDTDLSPSQLRNIESASGVSVLDRSGVIIEIFHRHARTKAARLQVEIARLMYVAPRLRESSSGEDRQGGGIGSKGSGESSLELDKRKIRDRIKELKAELASIGNAHQILRARRGQEICVTLVGYTNAGKSSLMRAMTGSDVLIADKLFATLDTTIRPLHPETRPKILLSDTVGFIKKLPHDLIASFKSTLDEALNASLLLFVVDASDPAFHSQLKVTQNVLAEVGAKDIPNLIVLNKRDRLNEQQDLALREEFPGAVMISTRNEDDLKMLRNKIMSYFESSMVDEDFFVPYSTQGIIGEIREKMRVIHESYNENGVTLKVRSSAEIISQVKKKLGGKGRQVEVGDPRGIYPPAKQ